MSKFKLFALALIVMILQSTVFSTVEIYNSNIDLNLAFVVAFSLLIEKDLAAYTGLALGLFSDIQFSQIIGIRALSYFLIAYVICSIRKNEKMNYRWGILATFVATILTSLLNAFFYVVISRNLTFIEYLKGPVFIEAIVNSILYVIMYFILKAILMPKTRGYYR